jgi:hypothetical protein
MSKDHTIKDNNRRALRFTDQRKVADVLPSYFVEDYPKLIKLLEYYYEFEDGDTSPSRFLDDLIVNRDITEVDTTLLEYIEDELLLGQSYFEGFQNKRAAAKFSNTLYRSKGTLYSIQQFFRMFYGIQPDVRYTKEDRFIVGQDDIGYDAQKFITDDKLYQTYAIQIKAELPVSEWREAYKLFVHPAGMYFGGEVQIVNDFNLRLDNMPDFVKAVTDPTVQGEAAMTMGAFDDVSSIVPNLQTDSDQAPQYRVDPTKIINHFDTQTIAQLDSSYQSIQDFTDLLSNRFDEDSSGKVARFDMDLSFADTFDEVDFPWYDSDSA